MYCAVILTALQVEYLAVRSNLSEPHEETHPRGTIYERGSYKANGQIWDVVIVEIGAGNNGAAVEAERAISYFRPQVILFVGVAGGIKDVAIGDVVASTKIYGYESGKGEETFKPRPEVLQSTYKLEQRARAVARNWELKTRSSVAENSPKALVGPIAAGEKVIASTKSEVFKFLSANYSDAVAVDMEGFVFFNAIRLNTQVSAIMIRGISDLIDGKNDDSVKPEKVRQEEASHNASNFAFKILADLQVSKPHPNFIQRPVYSQVHSPDSDNSNEQLNLSDLSELAKKFDQAPENITDPAWQDWFNEMFELQIKILQDISFEVGKLLKAHRTTVYFVGESEKDRDQKELWSIFAQGDDSLEIRVAFGEGISGRVAESKQTSFVPYDAYNHKNSNEIRDKDSKTGYRTYTLMTIPLLNNEGDLDAVFQFLNKLSMNKSDGPIHAEARLEEDDIDDNGFTKEDEGKFKKFVDKIRSTLDLYQKYFKLAKKWQSIVNFSSASLTLKKEGQDLEEILKVIIDEARKITNADRGTFWLLDHNGEILKARILDKDNNYKVIKLKVGEGFAGEVAASKSELNIPFDLHHHPHSNKAKETDKKIGYRTCSLICMPVLNSNGDLIGVTQLINKRRLQSRYQEYDSEVYPDGIVPDFFKASFSSEDQERLRKFNEEVAAAIQNAQQRSITVGKYNSFDILNVAANNASRFLKAHRTRVFLVDDETKFGEDKNPKELWSMISRAGNEEPLEISLPIGSEEYIDLPGKIANEYIDSSQNFSEDLVFRNESYSDNDLIIDPYSISFTDQKIDAKYRIYNRLVLPISKKINECKSLIAVVEFINKLNSEIFFHDNALLEEDLIDKKGFTEDDKDEFYYEHAASFIHLIDCFANLYKSVRQALDAKELLKAKRIILQGNLGGEISLEQHRVEAMEEKVKNAARQIVNAHRCTLWRVDPSDKGVLFANIPDDRGGSEKIEVRIGSGYVGDAAQRAIDAIQARKKKEGNLNNNFKSQNENLDAFLNIPFDVYNHKRSSVAKRTDASTGYRTCSILCMPILSPDGNELLGVVQLINKVRRGFGNIEEIPSSLFENKRIPPDCFMASFTKRDQRQIERFNSDVGDILQFLSAQAEISKLTEDYLIKIQKII